MHPQSKNLVFFHYSGWYQPRKRIPKTAAKTSICLERIGQLLTEHILLRWKWGEQREEAGRGFVVFSTSSLCGGASWEEREEDGEAKGEEEEEGKEGFEGKWEQEEEECEAEEWKKGEGRKGEKRKGGQWQKQKEYGKKEFKERQEQQEEKGHKEKKPKKEKQEGKERKQGEETVCKQRRGDDDLWDERDFCPGLPWRCCCLHETAQRKGSTH